MALRQQPVLVQVRDLRALEDPKAPGRRKKEERVRKGKAAVTTPLVFAFFFFFFFFLCVCLFFLLVAGLVENLCDFPKVEV